MILLELVIRVVWFSNTTYQIQTYSIGCFSWHQIQLWFNLYVLFPAYAEMHILYLLRCTTSSFPLYQNIKYKNLPNCQHPQRSSCCTCLLGSKLS